jgi:hypothetical protein
LRFGCDCRLANPKIYSILTMDSVGYFRAKGYAVYTLLCTCRNSSTNLGNLVYCSPSAVSTVLYKVSLRPQVLENHIDVTFPSCHDHMWLNSTTTLTTRPSLPHLQQVHVIRTWYLMILHWLFTKNSEESILHINW